ncbi:MULTISPECIES: hypothetical protein [unclassified Actinobaculum]|uniref:hypothetical protein n=1 Tax=unclassified Actinobaculum TaxID=2609299 RepID=UPI000D527F0D|nr:MULTISPECIES: hypothetical protein [unclassified Actinobaculum]AWE42226.1 hypothetical protein DDD63_05075 [Actinobaculum sp. 313]RTE50790.1 hypothetical protein EKN07_01225 [Actinobaculum sp. 352]
MADYNDLPELIGKLKLAAIDAYMVHRGFIISGDGAHYARVGTPIPGVVSVPETVTVTCPNEAGQGGGVTTQTSSSRSSLSYVDDFAEIRARIDDAL